MNHCRSIDNCVSHKRRLQSVVAFPVRNQCDNSPLKVKDENKQSKGQKKIDKSVSPRVSIFHRKEQMDSQNNSSLSASSYNLISTESNSLHNMKTVVASEKNLEAYPLFVAEDDGIEYKAKEGRGVKSVAKEDRIESISDTVYKNLPDKKNDCIESYDERKIFESLQTSEVKMDSDTDIQICKTAYDTNIPFSEEMSAHVESTSEAILNNMDHKLNSVASSEFATEKSPHIISLKRTDNNPENIVNMRLKRFSQSQDSVGCKRKRLDATNKLSYSPVDVRVNTKMPVNICSLRTSHSTPKSHSSYRRSLHHFHLRQSRTPNADKSPLSPFSSSESQLRIKKLKTNVPYYNAEELQDLESEVGVIDTHCHLDFLFQRQEFEGTYAKYQRLHKDSFPQCYEGCIAVFCDPLSFKKKSVWEDILKEENVWAAFGCHPHMASFYDEDVEEALMDALCHPRVVAMGEMGLDYSERNSCPVTIQHKVFRKQLKIALKYKLPLVIHCREAYDDGLKIMKEIVPAEHKIHLHCCTETWENVSSWLDAFPNLYIGMTNIVSFPTAEEVHEVAQKIPLQRLLLETDTPYFLPRAMPRNMRWSHPGMVIHVAAQIAAFRKDNSIDEILRIVRKNTNRMYGI